MEKKMRIGVNDLKRGDKVLLSTAPGAKSKFTVAKRVEWKCGNFIVTTTDKKEHVIASQDELLNGVETWTA